MAKKKTDFGYEEVSLVEKTKRVNTVFSSVVNDYDLMNDLMSFGIHRLWKRFAVNISGIRRDSCVLDLAGGTGDITKLVYKKIGKDGNVILCDINEDMLNQGRENLTNTGIIKNINYIRANAENLPFKDNSFDFVIIAFGLRNVANKNSALESIYKKLKYGSQLVILEFSKVTIPLLDNLYQKYSFKFIPKLGKAISGNEKSYQYLVESINVHPNQEELSLMMGEAGFKNVAYYNLFSGIAAVHRGYKV
tara:strand:- start:4947 stop:5693 length:747 start_codon:yes stop_codon:yes gene_type:complete